MASEPLTASDRAAFRSYLRRIAPLDDADLAASETEARIRRLPARAVFLECGERAVDCGTVLSGLVREFYPLADGREVTRGFSGPGDFVGSLSDLLSGQPALSSVIAEAEARIAVIPWRRFQQLTTQRPAWGRFAAQVTERLYLSKAGREYELLALDAEARYHRFRAVYAPLEPAIALRHVASYVGITPEHLSRLRRRLGITPGVPRPRAPRSRSAAHPGVEAERPRAEVRDQQRRS